MTITILDNEFITNNLENLEKRFEVNLSQPEIQIIESLTGYIPMLVKNMINLISKKANYKDIETYWTDINSILNSFTIKEISALKAVHNKKKIETDMERHLENIGILENGQIKSQFIAESIMKYSRNYLPTIYNNKIFINNVDVSKKLSLKELQTLTKLKQNGKLAREEIFHIISNSDGLEEYSDTQVDKFISRLRDKLIDLGISNQFIKTIKKYGYTI